MPLSILIAPDKFKGTLTALRAAKAIALGWKAVRPNDKLTQLPISDGGDGFGPLMAKLIHAKSMDGGFWDVWDAAGKICKPRFWVSESSSTAIIESANVVGLSMLRPEQRNPMNLHTAGLGALLFHVVNDGWKRRWKFDHVIVGVGGSATNDGGFGMATSLQWEFMDADGQPIEKWHELDKLEKIKRRPFEGSVALDNTKFTVAVDVQNPLLGPNGCTQVYGPQKGLREEDMPKAEAALTRLAEVWEARMGEDAAGLPGAGAAGGLGFGLHCFAGAEIRPGFEIFAEAAGLVALLKKADLVITGEGAMDRQTVMGKGVGELAKLALDHDCFCIGLAGQIEDAEKLDQNFLHCDALTRLTAAEDAKAKPGHWLAKLAEETAEKVLPDAAGGITMKA